MKIHAAIASIPSREDCLALVVEDLLPQVDLLSVYLNEYPAIPAFLQRAGIRIARSRASGNRGDAGKFYWSRPGEHFYFACDDDLRYPPDYVQILLAALRSNPQMVYSFHGATLRMPIRDIVTARDRVYHCLKTVKEEQPVHLIGTGVIGFDARYCDIRPATFRIPNMADVWFSLWAQRQRVSLRVLPHDEGWLTVSYDGPDTIYKHTKKMDGSFMDTRAAQTKALQQNRVWVLR